MKNLITLISFVFLLNCFVKADAPVKTFSKEDIKRLSSAYLNKITFENPVIVDIDSDGDFDALKFKKGNVEYYKNVGTLDNPTFILENPKYDTYQQAFFIDSKMQYPMFFADRDGDSDVDMFVVRDKEFNNQTQRFEYNIGEAENTLDLDTGTLITIILVLVIVLLILAILGR